MRSPARIFSCSVSSLSATIGRQSRRLVPSPHVCRRIFHRDRRVTKWPRRIAPVSNRRPFSRARADSLGERNGLERANRVVRSRVGKEAFVITGAEIPVVALVIFVPVKTPDAADHNQGADAIVPKVTQKMEAQVGPGIGSFEPD